jgi:propanol-preferring alcohol dehydrogenase
MSIPKVQIAAVVSKPGAPIEIRNDYPVKQAEELSPGECLIKMHCSGVCHTGTPVDNLVFGPKLTPPPDLHVKKDDWPIHGVTFVSTLPSTISAC